MKKLFLTFSICTCVFFSGCDDGEDVDGNANNSTCATECNVDSGISSDFHATINESLKGEYELTYNEIQAGGPFSDGDEAKFIIGSDGSLTVEFKGDCVTIDKALIDNNTDAEVRFKDDCVFQVWFLLSDNETGVFNEFNITDATTQRFYGQFTE